MNIAVHTAALRVALLAATMSSALPARADNEHPQGAAQQDDARLLEDQFRYPPLSARPRVWWHWMNGNITKDGIAKDLAWMKRMGIGGVQTFDANLQTPQVVDKRLAYMTPEWKDAFRFAAAEAERHGLELAIASSPGWSETGGPWVPPADGLKKLVWSETAVAGGKPFKGKLAAPPTTTGPFQTLSNVSVFAALSGERPKKAAEHYADVVVLAYPAKPAAALTPMAAHDSSGVPLPVAPLSDRDLLSTVTMKRPAGNQAPAVELDYGRRVTVRSAELFVPNAAAPYEGALFYASLEASDNGTDWRQVAAMTTDAVPQTASFAPVTARKFRIVLTKRASALNMGTPVAGFAMGDLSEAANTALEALPIKVAEFRLSDEARIDKSETKAGFTVASDYYALGRPAAETPGIDPATVIDLTARMRADGTLDWNPPKGNWRVLRLGYSLLGTENHPAPPEATGLEVDKFDGAAVRRYLDHYLGMYRDAAGEGMIGGRGVRALLTDSIEVGAANWTPRMIAQFKRLRGYDPTPWLPALTGILMGSRAESDKFLYDYRRTLADLMASEHYGTIAALAHENGLKVYGEALEDRRPSLGDDMAMRRYADFPMAAMWTHSRTSGPKPTYLADIKGAASVAHIYGQNIVAAESLTASLNPWNYAPSDLRRVIDLEFVTGVNRPVIHTSVHQPVEKKPGLSLYIFGQYFNRHESWAEMARPWVDYMARTAFMLQQGRNVADVGYFYGEEAPLTGLYSKQRVADAPGRYAYDFINADALTGALTNDGDELVTPGGARYKALYLGGSSRMMTLPALQRIAALAEGGATIIGNRPQGSPSLADDTAAWQALADRLWPGGELTQIGRGRVIAGTNIEAGLSRIGVAPDFRFTGGQTDSDIPFVHRKLNDGNSYYLVNRLNRPEKIEARFRITGKAPELWHADSGITEPVSYRTSGDETIVSLMLDSEESVFVVFRKPATTDALTIAAPVLQTAATLDGPWAVTFQKDRGAPASTTLPALAPLNESSDPGIKYFSGMATYAKHFTMPRDWKKGQPLWLDLGEVRELAEVRLNGQDSGTVWHAPYRIDIGKQARPGRNRLEITVANLWVNRLIGDAQPGATKVAWTAMPTYSATAPLRAAGLIGPVRLLRQTAIE